MTLTVVGAGSFGTGLAISLAQNGPVTLWARNADHVAEMREKRENTARLAGVPFPDTLSVSDTLETVLGEEPVLLAVPTQKLRAALRSHAAELDGRTLVACCKGIEIASGKGPVAMIEDELAGVRAAMLTGPSFARDIALGLPTALTLACADPDLGEALQDQLSTPNMRLYRSTDVIGAQLGGALKNVIAIACGAAMGAGLGESARAALITRGYAEMQRFAAALGADPGTLAGLSGFGDLTLTCTSDQSRNYRLGLSIGAGDAFDASITVEGAATSRAVKALAHKLEVDMPICAVVVQLLDGKIDTDRAMSLLLQRPLKEE